VFVAGATGAIAQQLVPRLVAAGHDVHGMTRSEAKQAMLYELGAVPVVADALDRDQVQDAVAHAKPDVIVHQLTAIGAIDMRHFDRDFALTNRLRTEGTDNLLSAGQAVGVRRFVAQSNGAFGYARTGGPVKSEEDSLDPSPAREMRAMVAAIRHLEQAGPRGGLDRRDRAALRRALRAGHVDGAAGRHQLDGGRHLVFEFDGHRHDHLLAHAGAVRPPGLPRKGGSGHTADR
jgi:nucleoside-diphosphate-sugar epimerase